MAIVRLKGCALTQCKNEMGATKYDASAADRGTTEYKSLRITYRKYFF